jgi:Fumarase C C-terminus
VLGYEKSAAIVKEALVTNRSLYELVLEKNLLAKIQLDDILKPENMTHPRQLPSCASLNPPMNLAMLGALTLACSLLRATTWRYDVI